MYATDADTDLEHLMRRWHHTTEFANAAWTEYLTLRDELPPADDQVAEAHARWHTAERERRSLMAAIEEAERAEFTPLVRGGPKSAFNAVT